MSAIDEVPAKSQAKSYFEQAEKQRGMHNLAGAMELYELVLEADPEHEGALYRLAYCHLPHIKEREGSLLPYDHAEMCRRAVTGLKRLLDVKEKAGSLKPWHWFSYYEMGRALYNLGKNAEAEDCFAKSAKANPEYPWSHHYLGKCKDLLGRRDEAEGAYLRAAALGLEDPGLYAVLGERCGERKEYEKALDYYKKAAELAPDDAGYHYNAGVMNGNLERHEEARENFGVAVELNPEWADAHYNLWLACIKSRDARTGTWEEVLEGGGRTEGSEWVSNAALEKRRAATVHLIAAADLEEDYAYDCGMTLMGQGRFMEASLYFARFHWASKQRRDIDPGLAKKAGKYDAYCRRKAKLISEGGGEP